ncbi:MAG: glutamine-hydrolyzing carbamoyl-phosphate synthase small subunit [Ruminococcaceae bacterium]|nr:glutamine-hydrolyzing carbamoyl-phosphate synthase small subunit [Oscillospiraceae bacterium]
MKKVYIVLEDGHIFEGKSFGAEGEALGELVFTTSVVGYVAALTDPRYYGQIILQTFPLIGNYGYISAQRESDKVWAKAYIVREWCENPSNFRCETTLDEYLKSQGVVGVYDVDTREITQLIREKGVMNAKIVSSLDDIDYEEIKNYKIVNAVEAVSDGKSEMFGEENKGINVTVVDFGYKKNAVKSLLEKGCVVKTVPATATADEILSGNPAGVVLSDGPGNPCDNAYAISEVAKIMGKAPVFGVGLGHQILALANGAETVKLKFGHRGGNQPVKSLKTGKTYITSQNNGYTVDTESVKKCGGKLTYINVNDGTCEGIDYEGKNAFSVQFHPESGLNDRDADKIFEHVIEMMGGKN